MLYRWFFFFKQKTAYEMRISDWSSDVCSSDLMTREHPVGGFARLARGAEDRAIILAQHGEPAAKIIGVAHGRNESERGAEEGAAHNGDQFLAGIILAAKPVHPPAVEPRDLAACGTKYVSRRPLLVSLIEVGGLCLY